MNPLAPLTATLAALTVTPAGLLLLKLTLVLAMAWALHGLLRQANPRWRVLLWRVGVLSLAALPLAYVLGPALRLELPISAPRVVATHRLAIPPDGSMAQPTQAQPVSAQPALPSNNPAGPVDFHAPVPTIASSAPATPKTIAISPATAPGGNWIRVATPGRIACFVWLTVAGLLVLRGWRVGLRVRRLVATSEPVPEPLDTLARELARELDCRRTVELRQSVGLAVPFLVGWRRPTLLLPARMTDDTYRAEWPAIVSHELVHAASGDMPWVRVMGLLRLLLWFHPLVWAVPRTHAAACEERCDAIAADRMGDAAAYSRTLARVAVELAELPPPAGGIAMARVPGVMRRLARLRGRVLSDALSRRRVAVFVALFAGAAMLLGCIRLAQAPKQTNVDLLQRYPTTLTTGDTETMYEFNLTADDLYEVSGFSLAIGDRLKITMGPAQLGIGHVSAGATYAILIPAEPGLLKSAELPGEEKVESLWLRFHPGEVTRLFPPATVRAPGNPAALAAMQRIAAVKVINSWYGTHYGAQRLIIPNPPQMTVDAETVGGSRRFFVVDRAIDKAEHASNMDQQTVAVMTARAKPAGQGPQAAREARQKMEEQRRDMEAKQEANRRMDDYERACTVIQERYPLLGERPDVNWAAIREEFRPRAAQATTSETFAAVLTQMLARLRDPGIWIKMGDKGEARPVIGVTPLVNVNPAARPTLLGVLNHVGANIEWARTADGVGYVVIHSWTEPGLGDAFDELLEPLRDTRALILDIRDAAGGNGALASDLAGRFTAARLRYGTQLMRTGLEPGKPLTPIEANLQPRGPWSYDRPVLLLIGPRCRSVAELFAVMLDECPQVKTMGATTGGSSGELEEEQLLSGITISLPNWILQRLNGQRLAGQGVTPDLPVAAAPETFTGNQDPVLSAALLWGRTQPAMAQPIAGESVFDVRAQAQAREAARPGVIRVEPAEGAVDVEPVTTLRIRFDKPMNPRMVYIDSEAMFNGCGEPVYAAATNEFAIPIRLKAGAGYRMTINPAINGEPTGFESADGLAAQSFEWTFKTKDTPEAREAAARPPAADAATTAGLTPPADAPGELRALLARAEQVNKERPSLAETIYRYDRGGKGEGEYGGLRAFWTTFRRKGERQFYGAFKGSGLFEVGSDGQTCWMRYDREVTTCPWDEFAVKTIHVGELFQDHGPDGAIRRLGVEEKIARHRLELLGSLTYEGRRCQVVAARVEGQTWWIDAESGLPRRFGLTGGRGWAVFVYDRPGETLSDAEFRYASPGNRAVRPVEPLGEGYDQRFITVIDASLPGSDCNIRMGKRGPAGRSSSGLN